MSNYNRPIIAYGNSFYINIELKQFNKDSGEYEYFDITTCHDVKVNLICAQHNTVIPLQWELLEGFNYILKCFVDYRLLHTTSYGVMVEGLNADNMHWRWTMLPKEGLLVVNNTSGMNIPDDVTTVDLAGRVGWGIQTDADLTNYYTKTEVNTLLENVEVDLDDYYTKSEVDGKLDDYYDKTAVDGKLDDYYNKTEVDNLLDDKQETLESGVNIKTVNGESILGAGNIEIQGSGDEQVQSDWNETDTTSPAYIQNKPDIQSIEGSIADVQNDIDNLEDDIAAQQAEINGIQTVVSGHQTVIQNQNSEISGIQSDITSIQSAVENLDTEKQDVLESGVNIKTVNGESILGEGNITIEGGVEVEPAKIVVTDEEVQNPEEDVVYIVQKPIELKTINGESIVGEGNIEIQGGTTQVQSDWNETDTTSPAYIQNKPDITSIEGNIADVQNDIDNLEDDIAAQQAEISGVQTAISGHQTAIQNQATEISGMQTSIAGHQTALENQATEISGMQTNISGIQTSIAGHQTAIENQATEISGMQSNISGIQTEISGMQTVIAGHQTALETQATEISGMQTNISGIQTEISGMQTTIAEHQAAIQNQATEISGMQTVLAGHQTALENQSGGGDPGFIKVTNPNNTSKVGLVSSQSQYYNTNIGSKAVIEGDGSDTLNKSESSGYLSHSEGQVTKAQHTGAHAEGMFTTANKMGSHAEGRSTMALGNYSHAEGESTSAGSVDSHAEGYGTSTSGIAAHAEGYNTNATNDCEHASGKYNVSTKTNNTFGDSGNTLFSVGNGTSNSARHNAFEIRQNGDIYLNDGTHPISSTTNGLKIEVVSALPSSPDSNTIYIVQ